MPERTSGLILAIALVFLFSARGYVQVSDTQFSVTTAEQLASNGQLAIPHKQGGTLKAPDGRSYSKYVVGFALYLTPIVAAGRVASTATGMPVREIVNFLVSFVHVPFALLALVIFDRLLRLYGSAPRDRRILVLALGLGSLSWRYAAYDFSEAAQMALLLATVYGLVRGTTRSLSFASIAFGALITVKLVHAALIPALVGYIALRFRGTQRAKFTGVFLSAVAASLAILAWLNFVRFGNPLESGYGTEASQFSVSQLTWTIPSLLFSFDQGLFVFSPVVILGILGWTSFVKRHRADALLCGAIVLCELILAGAWHSWAGGWSWGPRLLVPTIPLWLLPAAFWLLRHSSPARFAIARAVTIAAIVLQLPGVLVKDQQIHHIKQDLLTPDERPGAYSDYVLAWVLLNNKLRGEPEIYALEELGVAGVRQLDLTSVETFRGIDIWTEHLARYYGAPWLRGLPFPALVLAVYLARKSVTADLA